MWVKQICFYISNTVILYFNDRCVSNEEGVIKLDGDRQRTSVIGNASQILKQAAQNWQPRSHNSHYQMIEFFDFF